MKLLKISLLLIIMQLVSSCGTSTTVTNSWVSPDMNNIQIEGKIAVLVKIDDYTLRRNFEDKITQNLKSKGLDAISSYNHFTKDDLNNEKALFAKIDALSIGAALTVFPVSEKVKRTYAPTVSARVGVPVDFGLGPIFLGASVPIAGGSYAETIANLEVFFYMIDKKDPVYSSNVSGASDDANSMIEKASDLIVKDLIKKQIIK